jgi:hypothetical protein
MKKLFVLPMAFLIFMSSCKKSSSGSGAGTITASVDGTSTSFSNTATALESSSTNNGVTAYSLLIVGFQGSPSSSNSITLTIGSDAPFGADSTYTGLASPSNNLAEVAYVQQPGDVSYSDLLAGPTTVTIKSISSTNVQGTFSSTVGVFGSGTPASHTFTNGTFNLNITHQ